MLRAHLEWLCSNGLPLGHHCCGWLHRNASSLRGCWPETVKRSTYPSKPWHMRIWPLYALWRLVASLSHSTSMACPSMYVLPSGFSLSLGSHTRRVPETLKVIRTRVDKYASLCQQSSINYEGWVVLQFGKTALNAQTRRQGPIQLRKSAQSQAFILTAYDTCTLWVPSRPVTLTRRGDVSPWANFIVTFKDETEL